MIMHWGHGEHVQHQPIWESGGRAPSGIQGQSPWLGGQGRRLRAMRPSNVIIADLTVIYQNSSHSNLNDVLFTLPLSHSQCSVVYAVLFEAARQMTRAVIGSRRSHYRTKQDKACLCSIKGKTTDCIHAFAPQCAPN